MGSGASCNLPTESHNPQTKGSEQSYIKEYHLALFILIFCKCTWPENIDSNHFSKYPIDLVLSTENWSGGVILS